MVVSAGKELAEDVNCIFTNEEYIEIPPEVLNKLSKPGTFYQKWAVSIEGLVESIDPL